MPGYVSSPAPIQPAVRPPMAAPRRRPVWTAGQRLLAGIAALTVAATMVLTTPGTASSGRPFTNPLNSSGPDPAMTWYDGNYYLMTTPWKSSS